MLYCIITSVIVFAAWVVYSSRRLMLIVGRWILHRRYDVSVSLAATIDPRATYFVIPNHPAIVDPLIVATELYRIGITIRPLVDESFFSNRLLRHIFALVDAVRVPDFRRINFSPILKVRPSLRNSARRAKALAFTVLATLTNGRSVLLYPSGHITADGRESMSNRQLAHNVASQLPAGVRILGVRTRGLYGSMWSRVGGRPAPPCTKTLAKAICKWFVAGFHTRRRVSMYVEDITAQVVEWAAKGRNEFNTLLEKWYDADLVRAGLDREPVTL